MKPNETAVAELTKLADGPMLLAIEQLDAYVGACKERYAKKPPILQTMDEIIAQLEALAGKVSELLASASRHVSC